MLDKCITCSCITNDISENSSSCLCGILSIQVFASVFFFKYPVYWLNKNESYVNCSIVNIKL